MAIETVTSLTVTVFETWHWLSRFQHESGKALNLSVTLQFTYILSLNPRNSLH